MGQTVHQEISVPLREAWPIWMTAATAALYLDFQHAKNPRRCFADYARRKNLIARGRRGDVPLYHRADLDRAVTVVEGDFPVPVKQSA